MTVKELKEKLAQFPDDLIVLVPNNDMQQLMQSLWYFEAETVVRGVNELDGYVFISDPEED